MLASPKTATTTRPVVSKASAEGEPPSLTGHPGRSLSMSNAATSSDDLRYAIPSGLIVTGHAVASRGIS